jgi:hypothetical protein
VGVSRRLALLEQRQPLRPDPELEAIVDSLTDAEADRLLELTGGDKDRGRPLSFKATPPHIRYMPTAVLLAKLRGPLLQIAQEREDAPRCH